MISRYSHNGIQWVDLESPTREEVIQVSREFNLDTMTADELLQPSARPRSEQHGSYLYIILHFPALKRSQKTTELEIDFVLGRNFIITTRYDEVDPEHSFAKIFDIDSILGKSSVADHAGYIFYFMLKKLYKAVDHEVEHIRQELLNFEKHIFSGHEVRMVSAISRSGRDLLNLRQTIEPHRDMLREFETDAPELFGPDFIPYVKTLSNEYYRVHNHIMRNTEALREVRETNNSLLTTKQNETMRVLTVMALFTLPLALIVAVADFHGKSNPFIEHSGGFTYVVSTVVVSGLLLFWLFKYKKWL